MSHCDSKQIHPEVAGQRGEVVSAVVLGRGNPEPPPGVSVNVSREFPSSGLQEGKVGGAD